MRNDHSLREVTISLPDELLDYADQRAKEMNTSRSEIISHALSAARASESEAVAAAGYRYFSEELSEFASASARMVAESWDEVWQSTSDETHT